MDWSSLRRSCSFSFLSPLIWIFLWCTSHILTILIFITSYQIPSFLLYNLLFFSVIFFIPMQSSLFLFIFIEQFNLRRYRSIFKSPSIGYTEQSTDNHWLRINVFAFIMRTLPRLQCDQHSRGLTSRVTSHYLGFVEQSLDIPWRNPTGAQKGRRWRGKRKIAL